MILTSWIIRLLAILLAIITSIAALAAPRDVQITDVNFDTGVVEIRNLGNTIEPLDNWRFCSHNTSQVFRYSSSSGMNGISLSPGDSIFIHYNNDATQPNEINISTIGGLFAPLERDAYGLQFYFPPVNFGNGNTIADHLQWSLNGVDNTTADARSSAAESGGVWVDQSEWIAVLSDTDRIRLTDLANNVLHSPANYALGDPPVDPGPESVNVPAATTVFVILLAGLLLAISRRSQT